MNLKTLRQKSETDKHANIDKHNSHAYGYINKKSHRK